ncbi:di-heme oxidoredictase family protein [Crenothrix polyspora]|uniref:Thiol oxidoreductase-like protein n=1 Tax=Crenothrix polyspora TaxID=360316 RepID=A0A1R4H1F9_9GAMM|nr:di-heme oxidoredictase family protein [Crenothrix polyspora]SJM90061.1 Thiol oxidoreductase-like protein [Crenothrix polyspora]
MNLKKNKNADFVKSSHHVRFAVQSAFTITLIIGCLNTISVAAEAPAGFDNGSNGFVLQGDFNNDKVLFEKRHTVAGGLGPVYNAQSCADCHTNPITGGSSQVTVLRAGIYDGKQFTNPPGGQVIHDRATHPSLQSVVSDKWNVRSLRLSSNVLGAGFIEAIDDRTLKAIAQKQPQQSKGKIKGQVVMADLVEVPGAKRVGRFGWKSQHASLLSFNAEAFRSEMGITNALFPTENTANGRSVTKYDTMVDPENNGWEVALITEFVRATKVPPRDLKLAASKEAMAGAKLFSKVGCDICHTATLTTAPSGTLVNAGTFTVPAALASKTIHPYSDFLLHDIGTGDGIVQSGGLSTRSKMRTAPLWGLRTRTRLLHDGSALTIEDSIKRHKGESTVVTQQFNNLNTLQKKQLLVFLGSL